MSDSKDPSTPAVDLGKKSRTAATVPGGKVDVARPVTAVALAAALLLSGLAAIVAALLLNGHHSELVRSVTKNNPPVTSSQISSLPDRVETAVAKALSGATVSTSLVTTAGDKAADVIGDKTVLPTKNIANADRSDQQDKVRAAVKAQLKGVTGTVTSTQAATIASSVAGTVRSDLTTLHKDQVKKIDDSATKLPNQLLISGIVLTVALGFVAFGSYAGRYWSRWAVPVVWVLCSFTGTSAGISSLLQLGAADLPAGYKAASAVSAAALVVAVVLTFVRANRAWFEAHRPAMPDGMPQRRGLFSPRVPPPTGGAGRGGADRGAAAGRGAAGRGAAGRGAASGRKPAITRAERPASKSRVEPAVEPASSGSTGGTAAGRPRQASKSRRTEG